ncbi:hypothetical protein ABZ759_10285 [Streptomyces sp. NPDC047860]|uniref:hypothetical protein n=1 Tax=Streptomyces sp. NPDC047860 TaxID=3155743 RepID=UPI00340F7DB4
MQDHQRPTDCCARPDRPFPGTPVHLIPPPRDAVRTVGLRRDAEPVLRDLPWDQLATDEEL